MQQMWENSLSWIHGDRRKKKGFGFYRWKHGKDNHGSHEGKNVSHNVGDSQSWTSEKCEKNPFFDFKDENSY